MCTSCEAHDAKIAPFFSIARLASPAEGRVYLNRIHADCAVSEGLFRRLRIWQGQRRMIVVGLRDDNLEDDSSDKGRSRICYSIHD